MIKNIYINGASYCNGFLIDNHSKDELNEKSWVSLLQKNYNINYNIKNGKSLYNIYTETFIYLNENKPDLFICVIPFNNENKNIYYLKNLNNKYEMVNIMNYDYLLKIKDNYQISNELIDYFYFRDTEDYQINKFIKNAELIFLFLQFLKNKKIASFLYFDFVFFYKKQLDTFLDKLDKKEKEYLLLIFDEINKIKGMMDEIYIINNKFEDLVITKDNNILTTHPSQLAHQIFYEHIKKQIEEKQWLI